MLFRKTTHMNAHADPRPTARPPLFDWLQHRAAGVLLHPTSLPGEQGIGTCERAPMEAWLDFLAAAGMRYWQVCPLGPTGFGDSPYQCFSAFAANPYLIDLLPLAAEGWLTADELTPVRRLSRERTDFGGLWETKWNVLRQAYDRFRTADKGSLPYGDFEAFQKRHADWLEPYVLFRAFKDHFGGAPWWEWPREIRTYASARRSPLRRRMESAIEAHVFYQYVCFGQWEAVRAAAARRHVEIIGDLPIFVAMDSADAWSAPHLFEIDEHTGRPLSVAGVPPDYFSAEGQLWGNPLYRWDVHAADGYAWWKARLRSAFSQADVVRIDHFRGFDEYWSIPADAATAKKGEWKPGPGLDFFKAVRADSPDARIIAEDLGLIGPSVRRLREEAGLPGMAVLQFAFGGESDNLYLPHHHEANSVVYPGTHDNDTTLSWYSTADERTRDHARRYLRVSGREIGWDFVRTAYASVCRLAVVPLQDMLSLGNEGRFNTPGCAQGNWQWRYRQRDLDRLQAEAAAYLSDLGRLYGRDVRPLRETPSAATGNEGDTAAGTLAGAEPASAVANASTKRRKESESSRP